MRSSKTKRYTVDNNIAGTHNLLCAIVESELDIAVVHLGTMGVYGYGWSGSAPIPEGYLTVHVTTPDGELELSSRLPGRFNVANVLGALATTHAMGVPLERIAAALPEIAPAPGRFQALDEGQPFTVLIDYAHTPDSLENVLRAARSLTERRLLCVFGAGGDRDRGKRPQMGRISAELADLTIVTSDNPRSEEPAAIVEEILAGAHAGAGHEVEAIVDRREAIARAVQLAAAGDVVVVAGKGHEQGQELAGGRKLPFDDAEVAREALRELARA